MDIRSDKQKGLSYAQISRKYHIDSRTAKKNSESESRPVYRLTEPKPSKLDEYKQQIGSMAGGCAVQRGADIGKALRAGV